jgi:hypothetical protein
MPTCVWTAAGGAAEKVVAGEGTTGAEPIGDLGGSRDGPGENAELCSSRADASDDELGCIVVAEDGLDVG